jgi:hypothetical protein
VFRGDSRIGDLEEGEFRCGRCCDDSRAIMVDIMTMVCRIKKRRLLRVYGREEYYEKNAARELPDFRQGVNVK